MKHANQLSRIVEVVITSCGLELITRTGVYPTMVDAIEFNDPFQHEPDHSMWYIRQQLTNWGSNYERDLFFSDVNLALWHLKDMECCADMFCE
jgi:hypothetical protein